MLGDEELILSLETTKATVGEISQKKEIANATAARVPPALPLHIGSLPEPHPSRLFLPSLPSLASLVVPLLPLPQLLL